MIHVCTVHVLTPVMSMSASLCPLYGGGGNLLLPEYIDEIKKLLEKQDLYILALNETRSDNTLPDHSFSVHNYNLLRTDRNRHSGGACLYGRNGFNYTIRIDVIVPTLEGVCAKVQNLNIYLR